jgi:hypothetical protein
MERDDSAEVENDRRAHAERIHELRTIRRGVEALAALSKANSFESWLDIAPQALIGGGNGKSGTMPG